MIPIKRIVLTAAIWEAIQLGRLISILIYPWITRYHLILAWIWLTSQYLWVSIVLKQAVMIRSILPEVITIIIVGYSGGNYNTVSLNSAIVVAMNTAYLKQTELIQLTLPRNLMLTAILLEYQTQLTSSSYWQTHAHHAAARHVQATCFWCAIVRSTWPASNPIH